MSKYNSLRYINIKKYDFLYCFSLLDSARIHYEIRFLSYFGYIPCTTLRIGSIILLLIKIFILDVEYSKKSLMVIMIIAVLQ
jgi:hypothetical protein